MLFSSPAIALHCLTLQLSPALERHTGCCVCSLQLHQLLLAAGHKWPKRLFQGKEKYESKDNVSVMVTVRVPSPHLLECCLSVFKGTLESVQLHYQDAGFPIKFHDEKLWAVSCSKE